MLKLDSLLAFATIAEAGSISEAARRLQISKSVASERLAELERSIGATLVHRSTRGLALTEAGIAFQERAKRILREVSEATAEVSEQRGELAGPLRLSVPVSFGILHLAPALYAFLKRNPRIELSLELDDRFVGATDGFDAIIRHGPLPDTGWIAKPFAASRRMLVASPHYLKKNGTPKTINDLERHQGIIYSNRGASDWRFKQLGRWSVVRPAAIMRVNNGIIMRDAALDGMGIALLPTFFFHGLLARKKQRVVVVDVGAEAEPATIFIAYPNDRRVSAKVLALIAHLRATFGTPPYWEQ
jgi:DNA-binding transcriptional LysR family regulator